MPPEPIRIEAARLDLDRVRREIVRSARRDRLEPFRHAEPERELLVVPRRPHRDGDRLAADADLERLLDGDEVGLALAAREPQGLDRGRAVGGRLRFPLHAAQRRRRGETDLARYARWFSLWWRRRRTR